MPIQTFSIVLSTNNTPVQNFLTLPLNAKDPTS